MGNTYQQLLGCCSLPVAGRAASAPSCLEQAPYSTSLGLDLASPSNAEGTRLQKGDPSEMSE